MILPYLLRDATGPLFQPGRIGNQTARGNEGAPESQVDAIPAEPPQGPAACGRRRHSYTKDSYARAIRRGVDKANKAISTDAEEFQIDNPALLAYWAPNRLRHTRLPKCGGNYGLEAAQIILGHAKADVTQVYAERDQALAAEVMKKIG